MKKRLYFSALAVLIIMPVYQAIFHWPGKYLKITFCDVGQGDAILITYKFHQILIDGGPDDKVMVCLKENLPFWDTHIDLIVATHPDADHIVGLNSVLSAYDVDIILTEVSVKNTPEALEFYKSVQNAVDRGSIHLLPGSGDTISIAPNLDLYILWPLEGIGNILGSNIDPTETVLQDIKVKVQQEKGKEMSNNDRSIVLNMVFGSFRVFLPGDLESIGEQALLSGNLIEEVNILKTPHHGSKTSTTPELVNQLRPEIAAISNGKNNQYGHPNSLVLSTLQAANVEVHRTDLEESITFASDGKYFWLEN